MQVRTFLKLALAAGLFALGTQLAPSVAAADGAGEAAEACAAARR
jgi:hypothetical protein